MFTRKQLKIIKNVLENRETEYPRENSGTSAEISKILTDITCRLGSGVHDGKNNKEGEIK